MTPGNPTAVKDNAAFMAGKLKLMSHPERLVMLCRMDESEVSVKELVELSGLSQSSVSQHLALLRDSGVVTARGAAQTRYYSLTDHATRIIIAALCDVCGTENPMV